MSSVRLEPARLVADGDALYGIAATLSSAVRSCERALGSTGGMAGDDESAEVYAHGQDGEPGYDQYAVDVLKGALGLANALKIVDGALNNSARAYDGAQLVGAFRPAASSSIPEATPSILPPNASVPTSLGKGPDGPLGEFGDFLKDALATLGVVLPSADTGKLGAAESAWSELSGALSRVRGQVDSAFTSVSAATLPQQGKMLSCQRSLSNSLGKVSESASSMAGFARSMIDSVNQAWEEIGWFIAQMAVEIAIEIGLGALLGMVTFGAGAAAMAAKIALTVTRWALKIAALCKKLRRLVMMALRAARLAIRAGVKIARETISAGLASGITTISFNTVRGALDPNYQPQNVLNAALAAAAGGAAGGGASRIGAGRLTDNVANSGLRRATHLGVETGAGAIDGLASGLAESGLNGTPFSPLSSIAAGALLGGALAGRPAGAGGAASPSAPSAPSGTGVSTPDSGNIPSGASTGASSNNGGGAGPIDISDNMPTPGGGDAGSTTADSGGGVDIPSDSPTTGGGDGSSSGVGDGGGIDLPPVDAGSGGSDAGGSGADAPSSSDAPSTSPDAPGVDAPAVDAPSSPDAPSTDAPSSSDAPSTDVPATDAPATDAPATDAPTADAPTHSPDAPAVDAPATPAEASSSSDGTAAAASGAKSPAQQADGSGGVPAEPVTPSTIEPDGIVADTPADPAGHTDAQGPGDAADADATSTDATDAAAASATAAGGAAAAAVLMRPRATAPTVPASTAPTTPTSTAPAAPTTPTSTAPTAPTAPTGAPGHPESPTPTSPTQSSPEQPAAPVDSNGAPDAAQPETPATPESSDPPAEDAEASESTEADQGPKPETVPVDPATNSSTMDPDEVIDLIRNKIINPNFTGDPNSPFSVNCGSTASTLNSILRGDDPHAAQAASRDVAGMEADTGVPQVVMTPSQIEATLQHLGPGSHTVVGVVRNSGMGHWFVAYNHNGNVVTLDPQTGMVGGWPPAMGNVRFGHAGFHPSVVEAATGTTPELQPWSSHQNGVETSDGAAHPSSGLPDLGHTWNPPYTPPPNLTGTPAVAAGPATSPTLSGATDAPATPDAAAPSASGADVADPGGSVDSAHSADSANESDYGAREQARTPQNAREQELTDRWKELVDAQNGANSSHSDLTPEQRAEERQAVVDELLRGDPPALSVDADGGLRMHDPLELSTACPADCDPAEMDRQFSDANSVLSSMSVAEWVERRARFINHPADHRSVSGSAKVQAAEMRSWVRNRMAQLMAADPALSNRDARNAATLERRELNATHRLDMVAGGNPQDISGMGGRIENNKIGNIFKNDFVPQMEQHVLELLERVPPSLWNEIRMNITIGNVT